MSTVVGLLALIWCLFLGSLGVHATLCGPDHPAYGPGGWIHNLVRSRLWRVCNLVGGLLIGVAIWLSA